MAALKVLVNEFNDPELSYRRGYAHGASTVIESIKGRLPSREADILEHWFREHVSGWRREAMMGESTRAAGLDPFPPGVRPPREALTDLFGSGLTDAD
jgi:hypothetical protein